MPLFLLSFGLTIIGMVAAALLGATISVVMICVAELIVILLLLFLVTRIKRPGLLAGFVTAIAVTFLLCATCFGLLWRG